MPLMEFQKALVGALRSQTGIEASKLFEGDEGTLIAELISSDGFRFTAAVQRSWCTGRASKGARLTLSILPAGLARRLLEGWVRSGGGTSSFFAAEADAFLDFIAARLPEPSHALTICRVEQATLRASNGLLEWTAPGIASAIERGCWLRRSRHAALVPFFAEPCKVLAALEGGLLPPLSGATAWVLFAPGMAGLFRLCAQQERGLWQRLTSPTRINSLLAEGYCRKQLKDLLECGVLEFTLAPKQGQKSKVLETVSG
jgi:hypothetical protein